MDTFKYACTEIDREIEELFPADVVRAAYDLMPRYIMNCYRHERLIEERVIDRVSFFNSRQIDGIIEKFNDPEAVRYCCALMMSALYQMIAHGYKLPGSGS